MKILHVYRTYYPDAPGGVQEAMRQIALATAVFGVESQMFVLSPSPSPTTLQRPEGSVVRAHSWVAPASCDLGLLDAFSQFKRLASASDVIHYHFPWPFADMLHFAARHGRPTVMTYHSDIVNKGVLGHLYKGLMYRMLASMDRVVATSHSYTVSSPVLRSRVSQQQLSVIPLGICEQTYTEPRQAAARIDLAERFGLTEGGYFLFLGALRAYKGLEDLCHAMRDAPFRLVIAGSGRLDERVRQLTEGNPAVLMTGHVTDAEKMALIHSCRALVLPSHMRSEAFGMVLVEASMCSKPLISCEIGTGTTFVNADGETGLVVPPGNPQRLRQALDRLWNEPETAERMGRAARDRYQRLFSGERLGHAYSELYRQLLTGSA